jgi:hypothetical protein
MSDDLKLPQVGELTLPRWQYWLTRYNEVLSEKSDRIEKLEAALIAIKAMHHDGGIDDVEERDDRTYFIVCEALEATK